MRFAPAARESAPGRGPTVLALPPLFEEANRTRALLVDTLRRLAARGIGAVLPDLPGQNDSLLPTADARLADWRAAAAALAQTLPGPVHVVAIRGGALVDTSVQADARWVLAPVSGATLVRELTRLRDLGGGDDYGGNVIAPALIDELAAAEPTVAEPLRVLRLAADPRPADRHLDAAPLWRAGEPRGDPALAEALAADIADWIARCAG